VTFSLLFAAAWAAAAPVRFAGTPLEFRAGKRAYAAAVVDRAISIRDGRGRKLQEFSLREGVAPAEVALSTADFDFDGIADVVWRKGAQAWVAVHDPKSGRFQEPAYFDGPELDAKRKLVLSSFGGPLAWTTRLYKFEKGKALAWRTERYEYLKDGLGTLTVKEWRKDAYVTLCVMELFWDGLKRSGLLEGDDPKPCDEAADRRSGFSPPPPAR
jgi:hypothetical protein